MAEQAAANRAYTSGHRYTLEDFGLEHEAIVKQFDWAYERFGVFSGEAGMTKPSASSDARIVILSDAMSERNGVGVYYADLRAHLQAHAGLCEIVCPPHRAADAPAFRSVPMPGDATQRLYLPAWRAISRRVIALAPTCIIVATPGPYGFLGVRLARRLGIPLCVGFSYQFR